MKDTKNKCIGPILSETGHKLPRICPNGVSPAVLKFLQQACDNNACVFCQRNSLETQCLVLLGHVDTFGLSHTKIPDSQKQSTSGNHIICIVYTQ